GKGEPRTPGARGRSSAGEGRPPSSGRLPARVFSLAPSLGSNVILGEERSASSSLRFSLGPLSAAGSGDCAVEGAGAGACGAAEPAAARSTKAKSPVLTTA